MERMMDLDEMFREEAEKYKNSKSVEVYEEQLEGWFKIIDELREENKKLKDKIEHLEFDIEAWKKLQIEIGGLMGERDGLKMVVEKLHNELDECECSMHFENDEVGYRKRECKKLKEDIDYFRQCYLDLKKLCEKEGFMLSDDEVTKMFNLDKKD